MLTRLFATFHTRSAVRRVKAASLLEVVLWGAIVAAAAFVLWTAFRDIITGVFNQILDRISSF